MTWPEPGGANLAESLISIKVKNVQHSLLRGLSTLKMKQKFLLYLYSTWTIGGILTNGPRPELGMGMGMGMGGARCGLYLPKHQRRRKRPGRRGPKGKAPIRFRDKRKLTNYQGVQYSFNTAIQGGYEVKMKKGPKGKAPKGKAPIPPPTHQSASTALMGKNG